LRLYLNQGPYSQIILSKFLAKQTFLTQGDFADGLSNDGLFDDGLSDDKLSNADFPTSDFLMTDFIHKSPQSLIHYNHQNGVYTGASGSKMDLVDPKWS
jgi:hypothetical protein